MFKGLNIFSETAETLIYVKREKECNYLLLPYFTFVLIFHNQIFIAHPYRTTGFCIGQELAMAGVPP